MDPRFFRKYADLITEAETEQLNEGIVDTAKQAAAKLMKTLDPQTLKQIATTVQQATGGDLTINKDNAAKAAKVLNATGSVAEGEEGTKSTLGSKIATAIQLAGAGAVLLGTAPAITGNPGDLPAILGIPAGVVALLIAQAFREKTSTPTQVDKFAIK
jgi:hypothetical protein